MLTQASRIFGLMMVAAWILACPARANYLANPEFGIDLSDWHGDGERAFLKSDGTEGSEADSDAVPVLKIALGRGQARYVSQEIDLSGKPAGVHVQVDVFASADFQRSKFSSDYTVNQRYQSMWQYQVQVIDSDFWIVSGPGRSRRDMRITIRISRTGSTPRPTPSRGSG